MMQQYECALNVYWFVLKDVLVIYLKRVKYLGHRPVIVKRAVIGSKGASGSSGHILSYKVLRDWSIINIQERNHIY